MKRGKVINFKCPEGHVVRYSESVGYSREEVFQDVAEKLVGFVRRGGLVLDVRAIVHSAMQSVIAGHWRRVQLRRQLAIMVQCGEFVEEIYVGSNGCVALSTAPEEKDNA